MFNIPNFSGFRVSYSASLLVLYTLQTNYFLRLLMLMCYVYVTHFEATHLCITSSCLITPMTHVTGAAGVRKKLFSQCTMPVTNSFPRISCYRVSQCCINPILKLLWLPWVNYYRNSDAWGGLGEAVSAGCSLDRGDLKVLIHAVINNNLVHPDRSMLSNKWLFSAMEKPHHDCLQ